MINALKLFLIISIQAAVAACASVSVSEEEMYEKASALTKLTGMVEAIVVYSDESSKLSGAELLKEATSHDPTVLDQFENYELRASQANGHAVVTMCDASGDEALLHDLGCTAKLDKHFWQTKTQEPCATEQVSAPTCR
ncbi:MAG TPA: hypothetical protein VFN01_04500 [Marinobacter sp.]|uniref:hypothetical protein n=1 Tax=Marinobacter sp. TaxID=50741 RepID=UPI00263361C6|nr:hypothetical protein [Marinobacter sp.]HET8800424.1 hypothetical protein [Marinobacter sp.]